MLFTELELAGAFLIEVEPRLDERGFFARCFCEREFREHGIPERFPQCNLSRNERTGTLRGMHYERPLGKESKLVRCVKGAIHDVIVDLRPDSPSYLRWTGVELDATSARAIFVPAGFAHGFVTLADDTDVFYQMGDFYRPEVSAGFRWNDPSFAIRWMREPTSISERDAGYPDFDAGGALDTM